MSELNPKRALSLDALRGFAILTMVLSGVVPYGVLPSWMYHAQLPPPEHVFNPNLPGFTWVDLVFPIFLFCLGASIPLALNRRLENGESKLKILGHILQRTFLLGFFAIFLQHLRPQQIASPADMTAWLIALSGFLFMFLIYTRLPPGFTAQVRYTIKLSGWLAAFILLFFLKYPDQSGFSLQRSDIIIVVLTNVYFFASLVWLWTQNNKLLRLGIIGFFLAFRLSHSEQGWLSWIWDYSPFPWIYQFRYLQYLFIVLPGTIIGDQLNQWMQSKEENQVIQWPAFHYIFICIIMLLMPFYHFIGLQNRWSWQTALISVLSWLIVGYFIRDTHNHNEKIIKRFFMWGGYFLILGHLFEPYEGGIKKDHATISYYFICTSLSIFLLILFFTLIQVFKRKKLLSILIDNGQNPMIAYAGFANFIWPLLALSGLEPLIRSMTASPWLGFIRALFYTALLAVLVRLLTRKQIIWRI